MTLVQKQKYLDIQLKTPLGEDKLIIDKLDIEEGLSMPYRIIIQAHSHLKNLKLEQLLNKDILITIKYAEQKRYFHGRVSEASNEDQNIKDESHYKIVAYPQFWFLKLTKNCRIFQNQTVFNIIDKIFKEHKITHVKQYIQSSLKKKKIFCVQYNESDFDFISRLLEEEGIYYYFIHESKHVDLVFSDHHGNAENFGQLEHVSSDRFMGRLLHVRGIKKVGPKSIQSSDFDYESPRKKLSVKTINEEISYGEFYEYPGGFKEDRDGRGVVNRWLDIDQWQQSQVEGKSSYIGLGSGQKFKIKGYEDLIIRNIHHRYNLVLDDDEELDVYENIFWAFPKKHIFRPLRITSKPKIFSNQTAIVVGPKNQEIYCDSKRRIKVKFHWDLLSNSESQSSPWIRVSQNWAGAGWGSSVIPRIGTEVVVTFIDGDPDQPLVIGCVYNGLQKTPYTDQPKTVSTFKTHTHMGEGANELRVDDAKDHEEIYIHAQRDFNTVIEHARNETIKENDDSLTLTKGKKYTYLKGKKSLYKIEIDDGNKETLIKQGEGKTLTAALPIYLNALEGKGVHIVTVNDYLAKRDALEMGRVYEFLGLSVGYIVHGLSDSERRTAYHSDITYCTNHELGFDYLRDNMKFHIEEMVMRPFNFAIVDEVDCILIDEARTPLIISGPAEESSDLYTRISKVMEQISEEDYERDEKNKNITFTDQGVEKVQDLLNQDNLLQGQSLYDLQNVNVLHYVNASLRAHAMFRKDIDYIVKDDEVIIIDEFTGRQMEGRRFSDGLHQAIEAKEGVTIQSENQTLASITYQNLFRMYPKLAGMSGTVITEAEEFDEIYKLRSVEVPTNQPIKRIDHNDAFYVSAEEKYEAVIKLIRECQERKQPVLVGTTSIEKSEYISFLLNREKIEHNVLNARYHEQEAMIVANAGRLGMVTIATNMAGRGTDIKLGGSLEARFEVETKHIEDENLKLEIYSRIKNEVSKEHEAVIKAGGLFIIGTERHESRRIDNQLRGRAGRQGDPGASQFYLSIEDDLLRIFGFDQKKEVFRKKLKPGEKMSHGWLNRIIEGAQRKVEARNFDMRKQLLKYDDVMSEQRNIIYKQRRELMRAEDVSDLLLEIRHTILEEIIDYYVPDNSLIDMWDIDGLQIEIHRVFNLELPIKSWMIEHTASKESIHQNISEKVEEFFQIRSEKISGDLLKYLEKNTMLRILDSHWKNHLYQLDQLRQGINLRAYGSNPLHEYKREAFNVFEAMMVTLRREIMELICHMPVDQHIPSEQFEPLSGPMFMDNEPSDFSFEGINSENFSLDGQNNAPGKPLFDKTTNINDAPIDNGKIFKNSPRRIDRCFCGSGLRYKSCHGMAGKN